jgi:hypothetical protein
VTLILSRVFDPGLEEKEVALVVLWQIIRDDLGIDVGYRPWLKLVLLTHNGWLQAGTWFLVLCEAEVSGVQRIMSTQFWGRTPQVKVRSIVSAPELMMIHETKHDLTLPCDLFSPLRPREKSNRDVDDLTSGMDFNSIVLDLKAKGMNAREIHTDLISMLVTQVLGYSTVVHWLREAQLDQFSETMVDFTEDAEVDEIDEAILSALEVQPFGSVRDIARLTRLARSIVYRHFTRLLGFLVRHPRWIPHVLTKGQTRIRVSNSEQLLAILQEQQGSSWWDLVTLDG